MMKSFRSLSFYASCFRCRQSFNGNQPSSLIAPNRNRFKFSGDSLFKRLGTFASLGYLTAYYQVEVEKSLKQLFIASKQNRDSQIKWILEDGKVYVDAKHELGWTCLTIAVVNNNLKAARTLLEAGANPNLSYDFKKENADYSEETPPHVTLCKGNELCKRLNKCMDFRGFTNLHFAVLLDNEEMVEVLMEAGADPLIKNKHGLTPLDYARDPRLIHLMRKGRENFISEKGEVKKRSKMERFASTFLTVSAIVVFAYSLG